MNVTIYTDASRRLFSSWAYYAISDEGRIQNSGISLFNLVNIGEAEAYAIYRAVDDVMSRWDVDKVIINTDSLDAIRSLKDDSLPKTSNLRVIKRLLYDRLAGKPIKFKKVVAHLENSTSAKTKYNDLCHELANNARISYEDNFISSLKSFNLEGEETQIAV